ncbi:MAG: hypothetical protein ACK4WH_00570 [Phycisphaerales bacterium]
MATVVAVVSIVGLGRMDDRCFDDNKRAIAGTPSGIINAHRGLSRQVTHSGLRHHRAHAVGIALGPVLSRLVIRRTRE